MNMASLSPRVAAGEYGCDFKEFGCNFVVNSPQAFEQHYMSIEVRHQHVHLMSTKLRELQERVKKLEDVNGKLNHEIDGLKQKIFHLESQVRRVCATWEVSKGELDLPAASAARWENFQTDQYGYAFAMATHLVPVPESEQLRFQFSLRLRSTPHDRTLLWPFSGRLEVDIFPPDGFDLPRRQTCVVTVENLTTDQRLLMERPRRTTAGEAADTAGAIEILHPVDFSAEQLQVVPATAMFAITIAAFK